jgi:hypothetical protein
MEKRRVVSAVISRDKYLFEKVKCDCGQVILKK